MSIVEKSPDDVLYEVVDGQVVEKPPMGSYSTWVASFLQMTLGAFVVGHRLGNVVTEMLFRIDPARNLQRRPDVAFVSNERWPIAQRVPRESPWDVVPDLAIEVNSPSNRGEQLLKEIREYCRAGARRVWVFYPDEALVYVYTSPTQVWILQRSDVLDDEALLPGFQLRLDSLFEEPDAAEAP